MSAPLTCAQGALRPRDNDSRWLLDPHRRGVPGREPMRRYARRRRGRPGDRRLRRRAGRRWPSGSRAAGWRIVVLEAGPFWDPDTDWVSDEAGSHDLYWTEDRIIGGEDPVELGKNNSGRGVGGSMVHYAGYAPRFHPSDFATADARRRRRRLALSLRGAAPHYERVERELPVAGQDWPWGDPHAYPHAPHPLGGGAERAWEGARAAGIEMRVGPVAITNGQFGNRPHCIYRGFCLQGCKVNAKGSPAGHPRPRRARARGRDARPTAWPCAWRSTTRGRCDRA